MASDYNLRQKANEVMINGNKIIKQKMKEILKLQNISLSVNEKKINDLNLIVKNGDFFVINGKNAAGKSLLLKLLYLKIFPQIGDIFLYGKNYPKNKLIF